MRENNEGPHLLVAEDDPDDQWLIQDAINESCLPEIKPRFVADGVELMEYLQQMGGQEPRPDLIILDLNMPRKDGRAALQEIKADPNLANIPVVILTTSQSDEDFQYCQRFGVDEFFHKPSSITELENIFNRLCTEYYP
jgi:CheY-like chemotaxis protein